MWRYGIIKHVNDDGDVWYAVHEIYENSDGTPDGLAKSPVILSSEGTPQALLDTVRDILSDIEKDGQAKSPVAVDSPDAWEVLRE